MYRSIKTFLKKEDSKRTRDFSLENEKKLMNEIHEIVDLFFKAYGRKIDLSKF